MTADEMRAISRVNNELLFKIAKLERDVMTLHDSVSDLLAKNIRLTEENASLKRLLEVAKEDGMNRYAGMNAANAR